MNPVNRALRGRLNTLLAGLALLTALLVGAPAPATASESYRMPWDASETWQVTRGPSSGGSHSSWTGYSAWDFFPIDVPSSEAHVLAVGNGSAAVVCNDGLQATVELVTHRGHTFHYSHLDAGSVAAAGITTSGVGVAQGADLGRLLNDTNGWSRECGAGNGPHLHFEIQTSAMPMVLDGYTFSLSQQHSGEQPASTNVMLGTSPSGSEEMLFYFGSGEHQIYDLHPNGELAGLIESGKYSAGWDLITAIDLEGDGRDELLFYEDSGAFAIYDVTSGGELAGLIESGKYTAGWSVIAAIDLDGDGQDEIFFYRNDGLFRYYNIYANGTIGSPILAGEGYTKGWSAITAIDLDGDGQDEIFFYRNDGLFRFYNINANGTIGSPILAGDNYRSGWTTITAVQLDATASS